MKKNTNSNKRNSSRRTNNKRQQPKKDSRSKRINLDNERIDKAVDDLKGSSDKSNDVRWYAHNPELLRSAASLPFSQTTGSAIGWDGQDPTTTTSYNVPGVMSIELLPMIGGYDDTAVNSAKESIYSYVVHANSRNTSYNATDLMLVILAGAQVFAMLANGIRAYGLMKLYDQRSKYLPKGLVNGAGFIYEDLQANLGKMWFDINQFIAQASQIWIPNDLPFIDRWFWLNSNVYMDSDSVKGQYYMFHNYAYLSYDETLTDQGGGLIWIGFDGKPWIPTTEPSKQFHMSPKEPVTWQQYCTALQGMFDALLKSEDRGIMMGDILKAYGPDRIYALKPISSEYALLPVYNREVLTQIENCTFCSTGYVGIRQNQSTLNLEYWWGDIQYNRTANNAVPKQSILNFHQKETPTPEQIMVATRLKCAGEYPVLNASGTVLYTVPRTIGTEQATGAYIITYDNTGKYVVELLPMKTTDSSVLIKSLQPWAAFDWCPWMYQIKLGSGTTTTNLVNSSVISAMGDYDMYTVIGMGDLQKMHTTAVFSEFGVPTI